MALVAGREMNGRELMDACVAIARRKTNTGPEHEWFMFQMCDCCRNTGTFCTITIGIGRCERTVGPRGGLKQKWSDDRKVYVTRGEVEELLASGWTAGNESAHSKPVQTQGARRSLAGKEAETQQAAMF